MNHNTVSLKMNDCPVQYSFPDNYLRPSRIRFYIAIFLADLSAILFGSLVSGMAKFGGIYPDYCAPFTFAGLALFTLLSPRAYVAETILDWRLGSLRAVTALASAIALLLLITVTLKEANTISRLWLADCFLLSSLLIAVLRFGIALGGKQYFGRLPWSSLLIVDGVDLVTRNRICRWDATDIALTEQEMHPLLLHEIGQQIDGFDEVIVSTVPERRHLWANILQGSDVPGYILIPELDAIGTLEGKKFKGVSMVAVSCGAPTTRQRLAKRLFDLAITVPLLLLLSPLMLVTAIAIKLDSPGPVLFRQLRVGQSNRLFHVLKFRSMRHDCQDPGGAVSTARNDSRVTRVGRLIRATSIDELPQLLNILRGKMSLVGPRPHAVESLAGGVPFWQLSGHYHHRHSSKPGLTGLAQIRGFRGTTARQEDLLKRLEADLVYQQSWSLWYDFRILLATLKVIVHHNAF